MNANDEMVEASLAIARVRRFVEAAVQDGRNRMIRIGPEVLAVPDLELVLRKLARFEDAAEQIDAEVDRAIKEQCNPEIDMEAFTAMGSYTNGVSFADDLLRKVETVG